MYQLIYKSTAAANVSVPELKRISEQSNIRNRKAGLSGVLMVHDRTIMQILEGEKAAVRDLYDRISTDPRHTDCAVILTRNADEHTFGTKGMLFREVPAFDVAQFRTTISTLKARHRARIRCEARAMIAEFAQIA